jgi:hypothetical protein
MIKRFREFFTDLRSDLGGTAREAVCGGKAGKVGNRLDIPHDNVRHTPLLDGLLPISAGEATPLGRDFGRKLLALR